MKILFLDQSGYLGGAELCLLDLAMPYRDGALVGLFADGPFRTRLEADQIPVQILMQDAIAVRKESGWLQGLVSLRQLVPLMATVTRIARGYDLIYANTQKALVIGAISSVLSRRPLVYHLHDILSADHFSATNRRLAVTLANRFASLVIANSEATRAAFGAAGGNLAITQVVYNGFNPSLYVNSGESRAELRRQWGWDSSFVVGHFSRLSPWKGQHVLIEALQFCPENVRAVLVGDALFGEQDYVQSLHQQVQDLGLEHRVHFLGFRAEVPQLMAACDLVAHTSTAPEPLGRVIIEAMLCGRPVVAVAAGGAIELVDSGKTGWLCTPGSSQALAAVIEHCLNEPDQAAIIANQAQAQASQRFHLSVTNQQINQLLKQLTGSA